MLNHNKLLINTSLEKNSLIVAVVRHKPFTSCCDPLGSTVSSHMYSILTDISANENDLYISYITCFALIVK